MLTQEELSENVVEGGAVETTYLRFKGKHILKTNHSMFLTTILIGNKFFATLNEQQQEVFKRVAKNVAKLERTWSIEDAETYEINAARKGVTIKDVTSEETETMKKAAVLQYKKIWDKIPSSKPLTLRIKQLTI
jgi:TRAP-type C4-dicarboxylate transport system substrate-binding protein